MAREQYQKAQQARVAAPATASQVAATSSSAGSQEPPVQQPQERTKSDRYRVKGPGGLFLNGILHQAGSVVRMSELDALSVLDSIEEAPE